MTGQKKDWKANQGNWAFIQTLSSEGSLLCLTEQARSTLQTFLTPAYWPTRWVDNPDRDELQAFIAEIEQNLMEECALQLVQVGCTINLLLNGVVISSMPFNPDACAMLGGSDGEGGGWYELPAQSEAVEDKKTELFSGAMALVKYISEAVIDFFAAIDAEIELAKAVVVWMETVPLLDLSPAYEVLQAADSLNGMLRSAFLAADTPDWREQESCRIMCWCVDNNYTFDKSVIDTWREYLASKGLTYPEQGYWQVVNVMEYRAMLNRFALGMNDGDEDWMVLCDECDVVCGALTFDDVETDLDYEIDYGTIVDNGNPDNCLNAEEWTSEPYEYGRRAEILITLEEPTTVTKIQYDYYHRNDSFPTGHLNRTFYLLDDEEEILATWTISGNTSKQEWINESQTGEAVDDVCFIRMYMAFVCDCPGTREIRADNIQVYCPET